MAAVGCYTLVVAEASFPLITVKHCLYKTHYINGRNEGFTAYGRRNALYVSFSMHVLYINTGPSLCSVSERCAVKDPLLRGRNTTWCASDWRGPGKPVSSPACAARSLTASFPRQVGPAPLLQNVRDPHETQPPPPKKIQTRTRTRDHPTVDDLIWCEAHLCSELRNQDTPRFHRGRLFTSACVSGALLLLCVRRKGGWQPCERRDEWIEGFMLLFHCN